MIRDTMVIFLCVLSMGGLGQGYIINVSLHEGTSTEYGVIGWKLSQEFQELTLGDNMVPYSSLYNDTLMIMAIGFETKSIPNALLNTNTTWEVSLERLKVQDLNQITVLTHREEQLGLIRKRNIENFTVFEGKKNEIILLDNIVANTSTNNPRQIFGQLTGVNIWESDGAGLQLGIGGRGLSPDRTAHFNVRQNGYEISADALGYPEAYFQPLADGLEKVEVIRGAASLQYGPQFGGAINFVYKKPNERRWSYLGKLSLGSWNFGSMFHELSGTSERGKLSYIGFYQFKKGNGWRPNGKFNAHNGYLHLNYKLSKKWQLGVELTKMNYLAQQAGGLTDVQFTSNPRISLRERNWFLVDWNLANVHLRGMISDKISYDGKTFLLQAKRQSLGILDKANVADLGQDRTLISGKYHNIGHESRLIYRTHYGQLPATTLLGSRIYYGTSDALQGLGDNGERPNFEIMQEVAALDSDYDFINTNLSLFVEQVVKIKEHWSLTPGLRYEYIYTQSEGAYFSRIYDFAGNIVNELRFEEQLSRPRSILLGGLGLQYELSSQSDIYANASMNYRPINYTDLRIQVPSFRIDSTLADEKGYTIDVGYRYADARWNLEANSYLVRYANRIGQRLISGQPPLFQDFRFRTNIAASNTVGLELHVAHKGYIDYDRKWMYNFFTNLSLTHARYQSDENDIDGNEVEMVPPAIIRSGIQVSSNRFKIGCQWNYTHQHFSDASNAIQSASAVEGLIPSYHVMDISLRYKLTKHFTIEGSINNALNQSYFTRRAAAYPGPGIIPSEARSFNITLLSTLEANK